MIKTIEKITEKLSNIYVKSPVTDQNLYGKLTLTFENGRIVLIRPEETIKPKP